MLGNNPFAYKSHFMFKTEVAKQRSKREEIKLKNDIVERFNTMQFIQTVFAVKLESLKVYLAI